MSNRLKEKKMTDAMRIFEALSGVDEELLARCEEELPAGAGKIEKVLPVRKPRPFPFQYYGRVLAACFCLVVCGAVLWSVSAVVFDKSSSSNGAINLESIEEKAAGAEICEDTAQTQGNLMSESIADGSVTAASGSEEAAVGGAAGQEMQNKLSETESDKQSGNQMEDTTEQLSVSDDTSLDCPPYTGEEITLAEAKETALLGAYVPDTLPSGYTLESAYREKNQETGETEKLVLCWTKGMDSIFWTVSKAAAAEAATADVSKPETYDVHLYEIPYGETVPEQYREVFDAPVFAEADFSLEIVKARMKSVSDMGDTSTPRGNFAVLYEDGVLVKFNGRGTAESIYKMFP